MQCKATFKPKDTKRLKIKEIKKRKLRWLYKYQIKPILNKKHHQKKRVVSMIFQKVQFTKK